MELLVILVAGLVVLGPKRLPEAARQIGKAVAELRRVSAGFQHEIRDVFETGDSAVSADPAPARPADIEPPAGLPGPATPAEAELHVPDDDPSHRVEPERPLGTPGDDPSRT
jgi:Sec-independent protein translocase protein TatA